MPKDIVNSLKPVVEEILKKMDLFLYSLEYIKEDGTWFLRVSIERADGSMDFDTCMKVSEILSAKLDELDPIESEYMLEVCSAGVERPLNNLDDYKLALGKYCTFYFKEPIDGISTISGDLSEISNKEITLVYKDKTRTKTVKVATENIKSGHLAIKF